MKKKTIPVIIVICVVLLVLTVGSFLPKMGNDDTEIQNVKSITIWYTDEAMESYINEAAISYQEQTGIAVKVQLVSGLEYLEGIHEETLHGEDGPDVYIINSDSLEKARLSGLAACVSDSEGVINTKYFPTVALNAVTYNDKRLGYPFTYETTGFFYNDTYLTEMAQKTIEAQEGEVNEESILAKKAEIFPASVVDLLNFANLYDPAQEMETFLLWDVTDVMYNYGFAGAYMNIGGVNGDDRSNIDVYNTNAMYCLSVYQDFNQFFSIEAEEVDYEAVKADFISGKVMYTIAGSNLLNSLEQAKADGSFTGEYGIASIEMLNSTLSYKPLSVTTVAVVNDYSEKREAAEDFAKFLTCDYIENLYVRTGKLPAHYLDEYPVAAMADLMKCYENSVSLPKIVENSNYWILAELCYTNIWDGKDVNEELRNLSAQVKKEISGETMTEEYIETPVITESYIADE